jgi:hypothetical protein
LHEKCSKYGTFFAALARKIVLFGIDISVKFSGFRAEKPAL